jgi:FkbM family methyltransferase
MKNLLKKAIPASWRRRSKEKKILHMRAAMQRISFRGIDVRTVIDVGASDGRWSAQTMDYFPHADYLLVDANPFHKPALDAFCKSHPRSRYEIAAASNKKGKITFNGDDPFGGKAEPEDCANPLEVNAVRLDDLVESKGDLHAPFFLKLDTHGYEVPILEGAENVLAKASLVVIETYGFQIAPSSLLFDEMVSYMRNKGFGVVDISDALWRPVDRCLWQVDFYFEPLSKPQFQKNIYT